MIDDSCWETSDEKFNPSSKVIDLTFFWSSILIVPKSFFSSGEERLIDSDRLIEWSTVIFLIYFTESLVSILSKLFLNSTLLVIANDS